jgi:hypothetical protein
MADKALGPARRQAAGLLRIVERLSGHRNQDEPAADEYETEDMEWPRVWVRLPAKHHFEKVPGIVR